MAMLAPPVIVALLTDIKGTMVLKNHGVGEVIV